MAGEKNRVKTTGAKIIAKFIIIVIDLIHGPLLFISEIVYSLNVMSTFITL